MKKSQDPEFKAIIIDHYKTPRFFGKPETVSDLDHHRIVNFGEPAPSYLTDINALEVIGRPEGGCSE